MGLAGLAVPGPACQARRAHCQMYMMCKQCDWSLGSGSAAACGGVVSHRDILKGPSVGKAA